MARKDLEREFRGIPGLDIAPAINRISHRVQNAPTPESMAGKVLEAVAARIVYIYSAVWPAFDSAGGQAAANSASGQNIHEHSSIGSEVHGDARASILPT